MTKLQTVGLQVKRLQNRHHHAANAVLGELGITLAQWDALRHIGAQPDASLHDLAQLTFQTDQSFGTLAKRLAEKDLVERVSGPGRAVQLRLTEKGRTLRQAGDHLIHGVLTQSFAPLSAEQLETFARLLNRLLEPLD